MSDLMLIKRMRWEALNVLNVRLQYEQRLDLPY